MSVPSARHATEILGLLHGQRPIVNPTLGATLEGELQVCWLIKGLVIQVGDTEITVFLRKANEMRVEAFALAQIPELVALCVAEVAFQV